MQGVEKLLDTCKDAVGVHSGVLIYTSKEMHSNLCKAICNHFEVQYKPNMSKIQISRKTAVFVRTDEPVPGIGAGVVILFHVDKRFDYQSCIMPVLNGNASAALVRFDGERVLDSKESVLKSLAASGKCESGAAADQPVAKGPFPFWVLWMNFILFVLIFLIFFHKPTSAFLSTRFNEFLDFVMKI